MSGQGLGKAALHDERRKLAAYRAFLAPLDLKRRSLIAARATEARGRAALEARVAALFDEAGARLPMLAHGGVVVERLAAAPRARICEQIILGVSVPRFDGLEGSPPLLAAHVSPHWTDVALALAWEGAGLLAALEVAERRIAALDRAVAKATQRVNVLEKVLTPQAEARIRKIEQALADAERAAVVIAKIAKARSALGAPS